MPLAEADWHRASDQVPTPVDVYDVLEQYAPQALSLTEIRGGESPQLPDSSIEDALKRVQIQALLDTMLYHGDVEKKIIDGEAYYRPVVWID